MIISKPQNQNPKFKMASMKQVFKDQRKRFPKLDLGERTGVTGYIDFIHIDEFEEEEGPVKTGRDIDDRMFIVVAMKVEEGKKLVQVFFQRYEDREDIWAIASVEDDEGKDFPGLFFAGVSEEQETLIKDIINGKEPVIRSEHKTFFEGKKVSLW